MNENCVVMFLYEGRPILPEDRDFVESFAQALVASGIATSANIKIIAKDQKGIAKALLRDVDENRVKIIDIQEKDDMKALESAVIVVSNLFEEELEDALRTKNYNKFAAALVMNSSNETLMDAIKIIATAHRIIPKNVLTRHHMTGGAIEAIRDVYGMLTFRP